MVSWKALVVWNGVVELLIHGVNTKSSSQTLGLNCSMVYLIFHELARLMKLPLNDSTHREKRWSQIWGKRVTTGDSNMTLT